VYGDAYNALQNKFGRGMQLGNIGVNAANQMGNYMQNAGQSVADTVIGGGNAKASGIMGVGQAIGNIGQNLSSAGQIPFYYGGNQQPYQMSDYNQSQQPIQTPQFQYPRISQY
jgi:hypothetical protein